MRRAPRLCGRGGQWGWGLLCLIPSLCLPWVGNKAGVTGVVLVMGGVAPIQLPVRARLPSLGAVGAGVLARWRGFACSLRFLWEPVPGTGRPALLWPLPRAPRSRRGGGGHPLCLGEVGAGVPAACGPPGGCGGGGVAPRAPCFPSGGRPAVPYPAPPLVVGAFPPGVRVQLGSRGRPVHRVRPAWRGGGGGGAARGPLPRGPLQTRTSLCPPRVGNIVGVTGDALVMGSAPILFWCAAACHPRAWSARRSGALVRARPSAETPAGAGGWERWGARCAGPAAPPPPASRSLLGGGGRPLGSGGPGAGRSCGPQAGGGAGEGGRGGRSAAPRAPAPSGGGLPSFVSGASPRGILVLSGLPGGRGRRARPGRPPMGQCGGGGGRGGRSDLFALVRALAFPRPGSEGAAPFAPSWAAPVRRWSVAGRAGACGRFIGGACRGRGAPPPGRSGLPGGLLGHCLSGLPLSTAGPRGGGRGGPLVPSRRPPTAAGGRPGGSGPGRSHSSPAPLYLARAGPSCRPSLGSPAPPAVVARRWLVGGGREGQRSAVSGLRGSGIPPALVVSALPPTGRGARPSVAPYCGGGVGRGGWLC